ncbi:MAG: Crp/Fnr family transcriptional regulator [Candidatus Enterenecus sp.]
MEWEDLAQHPLFRRVDGALLRETLSRSQLLSAARGETVYDRRRFRRCLGVLLRGELQVRREALLVSTLRAGELFGAAALFNGQEDYPTTLTALTECTLLLIPQEEVRRLILNCPPFAEDYVTYLSGRIRFLSARLDTVSADSAGGRLAHYLCSVAGPSGAVTLSATQLCQRIGVGRATLYRAFDSLEGAGAIAREGKTIRVVNMEKLRSCCEPKGKEEQ